MHKSILAMNKVNTTQKIEGLKNDQLKEKEKVSQS